MLAGRYRLVFGAAAYFRRIGTPLADPPFVDAGCRFVVLDPDAALIERIAKPVEDGGTQG